MHHYSHHHHHILLLLLLLLFLSTTTTTSFTYRTPGKISWKETINTDIIGKGNGVYVAPDGETVCATTQSCNFIILSKNGRWKGSIPAPDGFIGNCSGSGGGGMAFADDGSFLVYAVNNSTSTSAIIKVELPYRGTSNITPLIPQINGTISGNPVISSTNDLIYFTYNTNTDDDILGRFGVYDAITGSSIFTETSESIDLSTEIVTDDDFRITSPWSGVGIAKAPLLKERQFENITITEDYVMWARMQMFDDQDEVDRTVDNYGCIYVYQPSLGKVLPVDYVRWRTRNAPSLALGGSLTSFSVSLSEFRMSNGRITNMWKYTASDRPDDRRLASSSATTFLEDGTMFFGTSDGGAVYAFNTSVEEEMVWRFPEDDGETIPKDNAITTSVKVSNDGSRVYFVQSGINGKVFCLDAFTGQELWNVTTNYDIQGDFSVSSDDRYLYFGANEVVTMKLFEQDSTQSPTLTPSISVSPSKSPTLVPTPSGNTDNATTTTTTTTTPTNAPTEPNNTGTSSGRDVDSVNTSGSFKNANNVAFLGVMIMLLSFFFL